MSDADKTLLTDTVRAYAAQITEALVSDDENILREFETGGMKVYRPEGADQTLVASLMRDYWDIWGAEKGEEAAKVLADIRAALGK